MRNHGVAVILSFGVFCCAFPSLARGAEVLVSSDFGVCPVQRDSQGEGSFKGVLPEGWSDHFAGWNKSQITSKVISEKGKSFLRFRVTRYDDGNGVPTLMYNLPKPLAKGSYRLTLRARNDSTGQLSVGLRMNDKPYHYLWEHELPPSDSWFEKSWVFNIGDTSNGSIGVTLVPCGVGTVDVATVRLERLLTPKEIAAAIPRPAAGTKNFFRNSRLPLGLQAGWNLNRMSDTGTATPDTKCLGPSGSPALKLEFHTQNKALYKDDKYASTGDQEFALNCEPFQVADPFVKNYVGFFYKGDGSWAFDVGGVEKKLKPAKDWTWVSVEFTPDVSRTSYVLSFHGHGALWLDSFCAWSGEKDRPYASAGDCEVSLAIAPSDIAETRIQFTDEPAKIVYLVTGNSGGAVLKSRAVNVYGLEKKLADVKLDSKTRTGILRYDVFPETPLGQFRVETWVERDGKRISPMNEIVVTRLRRPVYWGKDAPSSPFGCHFFPVARTIKMMKAGGINWARLHNAGFEFIGWWWLEPEKGKWRFFDEYIQRYRNQHIKLLGQLGTAPQWASTYSNVKNKSETPDFGTVYNSRYFQPLRQEDFANYVKTVVARYKGVIDEYFVWNEPFFTCAWAVDFDPAKGYITSKNPQADFARLTKTAHEAAHSVDPAVKIAGFNTVGWADGEKWTKGVYDAGGYEFCDAVDYHFYTTQPQGFPGSHTDETYDDAVGYIRQKEGRLDKPVYMSEGLAMPGTPGTGDQPATNDTSLNYGLYKNALAGPSENNPIQRADLLCKFVLDLLSHDVKRVFLYSAHDYGRLGASGQFCTLLGSDGYPHPSLAAISNLAAQLEDRKFIKAVEVSEGVYAYIFAGPKRTVAVLSGRPGSKACPMPKAGGVTVTDLFGNPLPADTAYKGTLIFVSGEMSPEAMETWFTGK